MSDPLRTHLLFSDSAHSTLTPAARTFDRFIGSWNMECIFTDPAGDTTRTTGEWHFGWILGGRMVQDVLYFYPKGERPIADADFKGGTTLRLFDSNSQQWHVSWFAAMRGEAIHLRGGAEGERIVLHGTDVDGALLRWSFNDVRETSFRWLGETSSDDGVTWRVEQEMHLHRTQPGS